MEKVKRIDVKEFRALGFLQEVNRKFFHPLGLALETIVNEETLEESFGGVWYYRDDPEGMFFAQEMIKQSSIEYVKDLHDSKIAERISKQGEYGVKIDEEGIQIT